LSFIEKENIKSVHFIGIGGIGMYGLAEYFLSCGCIVSGSDLIPSPITETLKQKGIKICIGHSEDNINPAADLVVYTSAVKSDNPELTSAQKLRIKVMKRAKVLGEVVNEKFLIAVAGTHGKTTTTAIIAKLLLDAGFDPLVFVGGNVDLFGGTASHIGKGKYAVVEADEYDRSFLALHPDIAVITNIEEDHLDIYKDLNDIKNTFRSFIDGSKKYSKVVYCGDDKNTCEVVRNLATENISYGFSEGCSLRITDYHYMLKRVNFSVLNSHKKYENISVTLPGKHNALNTAAGFSIAKLLNIGFEVFKKSIGDFKTVQRRLELKFDDKGIKVYDDYAHHPREIEASLTTLKESYPGKRIITVFQPHLYSRTRDFYKEFANSLRVADEVYLMDIYPAREMPIKGVTSELIIDKLKNCIDFVYYFRDNNELINKLKNSIRENDVVVFQGAGDITFVCDDFIRLLK
jgi:UDP-N-acetylmuramate--alanine ligase